MINLQISGFGKIHLHRQRSIVIYQKYQIPTLYLQHVYIVVEVCRMTDPTIQVHHLRMQLLVWAACEHLKEKVKAS